MSNKNFFKKASTKPRRLKLLLFGESGTGKTYTAVQFPGAAVIDVEKGTDYYSDFEYDVFQSTNLSAIEEALDQIVEDPGDYRTVVLDSLTVIEDMISSQYLLYLRNKHGNPQYMFKPSDYKFLKTQNKNFIYKVLSADLNIICTAKSKLLYDSGDENFMKVIGTTIDCSKDTPYYFDTIVELKKGPDGTRLARTLKDRTNRLPREFEFSYEALVNYFGKNDIERKADPTISKKELDTFRNRNFEAELDGQLIKTAGVTSKQLATLKVLTESLDKEKVKAKLYNDYYVESFLDLKEDEASLLILDLTEHGDN